MVIANATSWTRFAQKSSHLLGTSSERRLGELLIRQEVDTFTVPKDGADIEASPDGCVWSNDPAASDTSRRVILVTHTPRAFQIAKHPAITTIKVEPVTGIGDEAFYQIYPTGGPFLSAKKGNTAISIRILTRVKPSPFTLEQEKSKVALLGKVAAARL